MVLEGKNLSKSFDGVDIIEDVSLCVNEGEMVSLLGVSGVGKTTLFNIMSGLETPDEGEVYLQGECVTGVSGKIGYMQQSDLLLPFKSVINNVMIPCRLKKTDKAEAYKKAEKILCEFALSEYKDMYPSQLSGGMRQRVSLARTFMTDCKVMLLDEPFSALDAMTRSEMQRWFKSQVKKHSLATLFITHDIDEAILLSDRIYILGGSVGKIQDEIEVRLKNADTLGEDFINLKRKILSLVK